MHLFKMNEELIIDLEKIDNISPNGENVFFSMTGDIDSRYTIFSDQKERFFEELAKVNSSDLSLWSV